jgi:hypothetical protein
LSRCKHFAASVERRAVRVPVNRVRFAVLSRLPALLAAAALAALVAGCDLDDDPKRDSPVVAVPEDPFAQEEGTGAKTVDGVHTVEDVLNAYSERIGLGLRIENRVDTGPFRYLTLAPLPGPQYAPIAPDLGLFSLYVLPTEEDATAFVGGSGLEEEELNTAEPGVRFVASPGGISAKTIFGNVVLDWNAGELEETDERFQRLVDPLESLGGDAITRPSMRPCEDLAPASTPVAGPPSGRTCRVGPQVITFADPEVTVDFGGVEAELAGVGPGGLKSPEVYDVLPNPREDPTGPKPRKPPQPIASKKGQFLVLRLKVENKTDEPLEDLEGGLVIGDLLYRRDLDNVFYVDKENPPFPLQPGDRGELTLLFDLPGPALAGLTAPDTALVLIDPRNQNSLATPGSAPTVTRLRLFK